MAAERAAGADAQPTQCGAFSGVTAAHRNERTGSWWRQWWLASGPMLLYVTYIAADRATSERDLPIVEQILQTLRRGA